MFQATGMYIPAPPATAMNPMQAAMFQATGMYIPSPPATQVGSQRQTCCQACCTAAAPRRRASSPGRYGSRRTRTSAKSGSPPDDDVTSKGEKSEDITKSEKSPDDDDDDDAAAAAVTAKGKASSWLGAIKEMYQRLKRRLHLSTSDQRAKRGTGTEAVQGHSSSSSDLEEPWSDKAPPPPYCEVADDRK